MNFQELVTLGPLQGQHTWKTLTRRYSVAMGAMLFTAAVLFLSSHTRSLYDHREAASFVNSSVQESGKSFIPALPRDSSIDSVDSLIGASMPGNLENYDDYLPSSELSDADDSLDRKVRHLASMLGGKELGTKWLSAEVAQGDTIESLFNAMNVPLAVTSAIINDSQTKKLVSRLSLGQHVGFLFDEDNQLRAFVKQIDSRHQLRYYRSDVSKNSFAHVIEPLGTHLNDNDFGAEELPAASLSSLLLGSVTKQDLTEDEAVSDKEQPGIVTATIGDGDSFSSAASKAGISYADINLISKLFKGTIQFTKDFRAGDKIRVLYGKDDSSEVLMEAVEISLTKGDKVLTVYRNAADGKFYDEHGASSTSGTFRRFPLNGRIRISSRFNPGRRHPVLGYVRPHNGTDFRTPVGTPVVAPSDGIVTKVSYSRSTGYYLSIRHRGAYSTVYMHLSKILVKQGQRVKMGSVIARSGNTGLSTGPHLHYELHINGRPVDAMKVKLDTVAQTKVSNGQRARFLEDVKLYKQQLADKSMVAAR